MARCLSQTESGQQCKRICSQNDSKYCWQHQEKSLQLHSLPQCRKVEVLTGPSLFVFFPNIEGKRILLLGEQHTTDYLCGYVYGDTQRYYSDNKNGSVCLKMKKPANCHIYEIQKYLYDLANETPECLDLFVEQSYVQKGNEPQKKDFWVDKGSSLRNYFSPLDAVEQIFEDCYTGDVAKKRKCVSDRLRYHYIDVRKYSEDMLVSPFYTYYQEAAYGENPLPSSTQIDQKYEQHKKQIYGYLMSFDTTSEAQHLYYQYVKELFKSAGLTYNDKSSKDYVKHFHQLIRKEFTKMVKHDRQSIMKKLIDIYGSWDHKDKLWIALMSMPMDLYFISRLFIQFDRNKLARGPSGCQQDEIKNVILYGGSDHVRVYVEFFMSYFNQDPSIYLDQTTSKNQCLIFDQPFDFFAR